MPEARLISPERSAFSGSVFPDAGGAAYIAGAECFFRLGIS